MYFSLRVYLKNHPDYKDDDIINDLYDEKFETWAYGPVIPNIYHEYSLYGSMPIYDSGEYHQKYRVFDKSIISLLQMNVFRMVKASHQQPIWCDHLDEIINDHKTYSYDLDDIIAKPRIKGGI